MVAWSRKRIAALAGTGLVVLCPAAASWAHGFGPRYSLPIPLELFVAGAGIIVAVSFAAFTFFLNVKTADNAGRQHVVALHSRFVRPARFAAQFLRISVALILVAAVAVGFLGSQYPLKNPLPVLVWILGWVGIAFVCVFLFDVWKLINPWRTLFEFAERLYLRLSGQTGRKPIFSYPERLGVWPAFVLFMGFAWLELVWPDRSTPGELARVVLIYSVITWAGMLLFGRETWCRHGEFLSVVFGAFSRFAPFATRGKGSNELIVMVPSASFLNDHKTDISMVVFLAALLSTVTFDGILETWLWAAIDIRILSSPLDSPLWTVFNLREIQALLIARTIGLALAVLIMLLAYYLICFLMAAIVGKSKATTGELLRYFIYSLVPISVAYHIAHYFPFLIGGGQYVIPLVSDPLGVGWDLFGTASYRINASLVDPFLQWAVAISAVVIGHVVSIYVSHVYALRLFKNARVALLSQVPMVVFMIAYTMLSLWVLAQPIT